MNTTTKKTNGFYIPTGLAKQTKLTKQTGKDKGKQVNFEWHTKAVYSIYHYFTFNCDGLGYCTITAEEVANRLGISLRTVRYCRQLLKECNYISTDGGIKTTALVEYKEGCTDCHHNKEIMGAQIVTVEEKESAEGCTDCQQGVHGLSTEGAQIVTEGCTDCHHNKERIKKNKDINLESINEKPLNNESVKESETNLKPSSNSNEMEFDELLNTPSPKDIADAKRERVENISKRFFQSVERHRNADTQPLQSDINKIAQRLDEIDCKEARQLKRIMNDVLKNSFNGLEVYLYPTTTPSNVSATASVAGGAYGDLPF